MSNILVIWQKIKIRHLSLLSPTSFLFKYLSLAESAIRELNLGIWIMDWESEISRFGINPDLLTFW